MKKTLLIAAFSVCSLLTVTGSAKAAEKVSGKYHYEILDNSKKTATLTKVDAPGTDITLPSKVDGYTIVQLGTMNGNDYDFYYAKPEEKRVAIFSVQEAKAITKLSLPNKLEKIGVQALRDCSQVKKVSLPSSLTHIGAEAFRDCQSVKSVTIPKNVKGIGSGAFSRCLGMEKVTFKTSKAKVGSEAFATDDCVYHLDVKGGKGSHLKKIVMPYNYKGFLKKGAFSGYVGTSFTWRNFNTYNEGFLNGCKTLKKIVFPKKLKTIDIPRFCLDDSLSKLKSMVIPEGAKIVYIGQQRFGNIKCLTIKGKNTVLKGDNGMGKNMISVNTVKCKKNSKVWKTMKKYCCPNFAKKFKEEIETDGFYTKKNVHTKKVKVKKL